MQMLSALTLIYRSTSGILGAWYAHASRRMRFGASGDAWIAWSTRQPRSHAGTSYHEQMHANAVAKAAARCRRRC
jgi:hypothetical protein